MLTRPRFVFGSDSNGALAAYRTFVFTDTAANAKPGVHVGLLESNLKRHGILRLRRFCKRQFTVNLKTAGRIGDDPPGSSVW